MPSDIIKIRVRSGSSEAEIEADLAHIKEAIELIPEVVKKLPNGKQSSQSFPTGVPASGPASESGDSRSTLPMVSLEKSDSLTDIIGKFFADTWGRKRRKLSDVREALQSYGLNYPKQSVAVALLRLAKTTKVRRFKADDGEYVYTASTAMLPQQPSLQDSSTIDSMSETNL